MHSKQARLIVWGIVLGSLTMAAATPLLRSGEKPRQAARKTTDPPTMSRGKFGQDLFLAIDHRDVAGVRALLKRGADPNSRNGLELTPLAIAAASYQPDVVDALLKAGAKPDAGSSYGTALTFASATGNVQAIQTLLSKGVKVDAMRGDGNTPLMMASNAGAPPAVLALVKAKADVNAKNVNDSTALTYAARGGHVDAGRILIEAGANVNNADLDGQTPLMAAAMTGHADFVKLLLERGAKVNAKDSKKRTALILAASYGDYPEVVKALLDAGADAKATDTKGRTAAILASTRGYSDSASALGSPSMTPRARQTRDAATIGLKILQSSMTQFGKNATCISCHQEGLGRMVTGEAVRHGLTIDQMLSKSQSMRVNGALNAMQPLHAAALKSPEAMKQIPLIEMNEVASGYTWLLAGKAAHNEPANQASAAMAMVLAKQQSPNGYWSFSLPRVPMQSSFFTLTALAVRSLNTYGPKANAAEIKDRIGKAKGWLLQAEAKTGDDRAMRLLGLKWAGATMDDRRKAIDELLAGQNPNGGWSQLPGMYSDAYATGQALYALHVGGGMSVNDPVYQKGVKFLLQTQDDDGSWFVNKRAFPANNYFDGGFPFGESQYASFIGTCWATMALTATLEK